MTEKVEELILEQLFKLSDKIDNLHTEMNARFAEQDKKIDEKLEKITQQFDEKLERQNQQYDEKLEKQKKEIVEKIEKQGKKIYEKIEEVEMSTAQIITDVTKYDEEKRREIENKIIDISKMRK